MYPARNNQVLLLHDQITFMERTQPPTQTFHMGRMCKASIQASSVAVSDTHMGKDFRHNNNDDEKVCDKGVKCRFDLNSYALYNLASTE